MRRRCKSTTLIKRMHYITRLMPYACLRRIVYQPKSRAWTNVLLLLLLFLLTLLRGSLSCPDPGMSPAEPG